MKINANYSKLSAGYLFPEIAKRVRNYSSAHPDAKIIRLGIGDVVLPLPKAVLEAMHQAVDEMGTVGGFHGYGPEQGYEFLRKAIVEEHYKARGVILDFNEIFISDGSKQDCGNIQEIFSQDTIIAVADPVYPVYVDTNVMAGRTGTYLPDQGRYEGIVYLSSTKENNFSPPLPSGHVDVIYLCSPNNPTGAVLDKPTLQKWVEYAHREQALILFDAAYESYIQDTQLPHSIYEIPGADEVAIEFNSFSKNAGFTGTRCAYTVIPKKLMGYGSSGESISLHQLWNRRQSTKYNGVPYIIQKGAEAVYSSAGKEQVQALVSYYLTNAQLILKGLSNLGIECYGGRNAPYIWFRIPSGLNSWQMFDKLLNEAHVVGTPGSGFGPAGEGYMRLSAFGLRQNVEEALERIKLRLKL